MPSDNQNVLRCTVSQTIAQRHVNVFMDEIYTNGKDAIDLRVIKVHVRKPFSISTYSTTHSSNVFLYSSKTSTSIRSFVECAPQL